MSGALFCSTFRRFALLTGHRLAPYTVDISDCTRIVHSIYMGFIRTGVGKLVFFAFDRPGRFSVLLLSVTQNTRAEARSRCPSFPTPPFVSIVFNVCYFMRCFHVVHRCSFGFKRRLLQQSTVYKLQKVRPREAIAVKVIFFFPAKPTSSYWDRP